jgi:hypothetical protein
VFETCGLHCAALLLLSSLARSLSLDVPTGNGTAHGARKSTVAQDIPSEVEADALGRSSDRDAKPDPKLGGQILRGLRAGAAAAGAAVSSAVASATATTTAATAAASLGGGTFDFKAAQRKIENAKSVRSNPMGWWRYVLQNNTALFHSSAPAVLSHKGVTATYNLGYIRLFRLFRCVM